MFTETILQRTCFVGQIPPSNHAANTDTSVAGIDMSTFRRLVALLDIGVLGSSANVQLYFRASASANMASPTNVASSIPVTAATSNRVGALEVRADQLPLGTRYVQPVMIVNTAASNVGLIVMGQDSSYAPGNQYNVANILDQSAVT